MDVSGLAACDLCYQCSSARLLISTLELISLLSLGSVREREPRGGEDLLMLAAWRGLAALLTGLVYARLCFVAKHPNSFNPHRPTRQLMSHLYCCAVAC